MLDLRPYPEFNYEAAKNKLLSLKIDSEHGPRIAFVVPGDVYATDAEHPDEEDDFAWRQAQFMQLSGWVSLESRLSVRPNEMDSLTSDKLSSQVGCAGAVLSHLQRRRASRYLPGDGAAHMFFRVSTIEMFTLKETMQVHAC